MKSKTFISQLDNENSFLRLRGDEAWVANGGG